MMTGDENTRLSRTSRLGLALASACGLALTLALAGCATTRDPGPISAKELAEAQNFPYYRTYWVGRTFAGYPLAAADGRNGYNGTVGDSVYYGNCVQSQKLAGGGACTLPLQVTTVIYKLHGNRALGAQHNILVHGVPAVVYDEGHSIELYSGHVAIDIFSDTFAHALAAANRLRPLNAPGNDRAPLPSPVFCPGLWGPQEAAVEHAMAHLPGRACQQAAKELEFAEGLRTDSGRTH
jgi:hypothetical protein